MQIVRDIKEKHSRVALNYEKELEDFGKSSNETIYILPDES